MFLIAKLHPNIEKTEEKDYNGLLLSGKSKKAVINRYYKENQEIWLCVDHRGIDSSGYVDEANRVGRVSDLFLNQEGELMVKCELFQHHTDGYKEVNKGLFRDTARWGVSVGLVGVNDPVSGKKKSRNLVHVALTSDPAFADEGTLITAWGLDEKEVDWTIANKYQKGFFRPELRAKLEGYLKKDVVAQVKMDNSTAAASLTPPQQQQQQQQEEEEKHMELDGSKATFDYVPRTTAEKSAEFKRMVQHMATNGFNLEHMDRAFRTKYNNLEEEIEKGTEEENAYVNDLCSEYNIKPEHKDELFKMLSGTTPDAIKHQPMMVELMCCSATKYKEQEMRNAAAIAELQKEKEAFALENERMKKQMEQEEFNKNNKRARPLPSPYNGFTQLPYNNTPKQKQVSLPLSALPHKQQQQDSSNNPHSYLEQVNVRGKMPINNPLVNGLVHSERNASGVEVHKRNPFFAKSKGELEQFNALDVLCNGNAKKASFHSY